MFNYYWCSTVTLLQETQTVNRKGLFAVLFFGIENIDSLKRKEEKQQKKQEGKKFKIDFLFRWMVVGSSLDYLVKAFGYAFSFYSTRGMIVSSVSLMAFIDSFSLFTRLVLISELYTASPFVVRE